MVEDDTPVVEVQYNEMFINKPFIYFDPDKKEIMYADFREKGYVEFIAHLSVITRRMCKDVYYCPDGQTLCQGLATLHNECDYHEFLECLHEKKKVTVYVDHMHEPLFDWIQMEEPEVEDDTTSNADEDVDDEDVSMKRATTTIQKKGMFFNKLCPNVEKEEDSNVEQLPPHGYDLWYEKNDKNKLLVKCCKDKEPTCPFRLWAPWTREERTFQIKSLKSSHKYGRVFKIGLVTYKWIGKQYFNVLLENPRLSLRKMKSQISSTYNIIVSIGQCRNAKKFALSEIEGTLKEPYSRLWDYGIEIKRANLGSTMNMEVDYTLDGSLVSKRLYVCFKGVEGCRQIIGIDGCFLKGIYKGELLAAVGRDANSNMFPLAWVVVTVENKETWKWFLDLLMDDIDRGNGNWLTLISDGHKGLIEAIKERVPHDENILCARHILANFNTRFKGAFDYLIERDPKCYCRDFQEEGVFCDAVENGISESFNAEIVQARHKPIIAMLEDIGRIKGESWDLTICPSIRKKIGDLKEKQRFWDVYPCGYQQFEVVLCNDMYVIDLIRRTCGCRRWQLTRIPCVHGVTAISSMNLNLEEYVASCYSKETYLTCYAYIIHPLNDSSLWTQSEYTKPLPPKSRMLPGRPSTKRRKSTVEREISSTHTQCPTKRIPITGDLAPGSSTPTPIPTLGSTFATPRSTPATLRPRSTLATLRPTPATPIPRSTPTTPIPRSTSTRPVQSERKASERIIKQCLRKKVVPKDGSGCSSEKHVDLA
uniref:SWIM-type domain-containing protein n=1 Tax=Lactuca sativa TaxID=4236 RepID=A0A9R1WAR5_LACSA|nr:hypothetical protein LSAT_V11C300130470 [Lactuca sativa]